jgi:hypothetical protein
MPETMNQQADDRADEAALDETAPAGDPLAGGSLDGGSLDGDPLGERVRGVRAGLTRLLAEAELARRRRAEASGGDGAAVCAWNHFENIPTFYNWNNRPR